MRGSVRARRTERVNPLRVKAIVFGLAAAVSFAAGTLPAPAGAQSTVDTPEAVGDQLFFFYDASGPRAAFLNVANPSDIPVDLEISFYPSTGGRQESRSTLGAWANLVVEPSGVPGVGGTFGLAVVTPVSGPTSAQPIVPAQPLAGSFTQANTTGGAAFGSNAIGRLAVNASGIRAAAGSDVDGASVLYQRFTPSVLAIPTYFDPTTLDPPENDGNRVILITFEDSYGSRYDPVSPSGSLAWALFDGGGAEVARGAQSASMVLSTSLQALAGGNALASSGKAFFEYDTGQTGNVFGLFQQSLAAFGAGDRMPAVGTFPPA